MASRSSRADGDLTSRKILDTAGRLFAQTGYAHTTSKMICIEAGVDLAAINYHFGSRDHLYQMVLIEGHRHLIDLQQLQNLVELEIDAEQKLNLLIDHLVEKMQAEDSWHSRVFAQELLSPTPHLQVLIKSGILPKAQLGLQLLHQLMGVPANDPALIRCLISIFAPCLMLIMIGGRVAGPAQQMLKMPKQELAQHLKCFSLGGINAVKQLLANNESV